MIDFIVRIYPVIAFHWLTFCLIVTGLSIVFFGLFVWWDKPVEYKPKFTHIKKIRAIWKGRK